MKAKATVLAVLTIGWFAYAGFASPGATEAFSGAPDLISPDGPTIWAMAVGSLIWPILLIPVIVALATQAPERVSDEAGIDVGRVAAQ
mgnify:CR=1 FL=1